MIKLFPENLINAVCDGLVYSLVLGVLLAAVTGMIILFTRKANPAMRHNLLLGSLIIFTGTILFSFLKQLAGMPASFEMNKLPAGLIPAEGSVVTDIVDINYYVRLITFFREYSNGIVLVWLLIVIMKSFKLIIGLQSIADLKQKQISTLNDEWNQRIRMLANELGIHRVVRIAASGIASVPMVIGYLKPLILVPAGLITALPPESIEAILIHELAHIRRRDWLINLLLCSMEVIFFFNPAVLWVTSLVRAERENCCDDVAVTYIGSKTRYIDTLVACQQYQLSLSNYALAFNSQKKPLLARIKRMISDRNSPLNRTERGIIATTLLITLIGIGAFSPVQEKQKDTRQVVTGITLPDSLNENRYPQQSYRPVHKSDVLKANKFQTIPDSTILGPLEKLDGKLYPLNSKGNDLLEELVIDTTKNDQEQVLFPGSMGDYKKTDSYTKPYTQYQPYQKTYKPYDDSSNVEKLAKALITAQVIQHKEELISFKLSDKEFILNDIKMPDEIYLPIRIAFVKMPLNGKGTWAWMYNYKS